MKAIQSWCVALSTIIIAFWLLPNLAEAKAPAASATHAPKVASEQAPSSEAKSGVDRPGSDKKVPVDYFNRVSSQAEESGFVREVAEAIHEIVRSWPSWPKDPLKELNQILSQSKLSEDPKKKAVAEIVIKIHQMKLADVYSLFGTPGKDKRDSSFMKIADQYLRWIEEADADLVKLLTNDGKWQQVTERNIVILLDQLRKALARRDRETEVKLVTRYLFTLAPQQWGAFATSLNAYLEKKSPKDRSYDRALALARGVNILLAKAGQGGQTKALADRAGNDSGYREAYEKNIDAKNRDGVELLSATENYVKKASDGTYYLDPQHADAFQRAIQKHSPEKLWTFATGVIKGDGTTSPNKEFGLRLATALSRLDGQRSLIVPLEKAPALADDKKSENLAAIRLATPSGKGSYRPSDIEKAVLAWDGGPKLSDFHGHPLPRSHGYSYQNAGTIADLAPSQGHARQLWYMGSDGKLAEKDIRSKADAPELIKFEAPPQFKFEDPSPKLAKQDARPDPPKKDAPPPKTKGAPATGFMELDLSSMPPRQARMIKSIGRWLNKLAGKDVMTFKDEGGRGALKVTVVSQDGIGGDAIGYGSSNWLGSIVTSCHVQLENWLFRGIETRRLVPVFLHELGHCFAFDHGAGGDIMYFQAGYLKEYSWDAVKRHADRLADSAARQLQLRGLSRRILLSDSGTGHTTEGATYYTGKPQQTYYSSGGVAARGGTSWLDLN